MHTVLPSRVKTQYFSWKAPFPEEAFVLESGKTLEEWTLAYQTYGKLSPEKDNAILLCHALSGDAHVAGIHEEDGRKGWWDAMVGPGKAFDTDRYFIMCSNVLGGCQGSTGPASLHPKEDQPYGLRFPLVTIHDMVRAQQKWIASQGISQLLAVGGGSMGGMQALAWSQLFPKQVQAVIPMATAGKHSPQNIAWNEIGRRAIMGDPKWANGNYYQHGVAPETGLGIARMIGHVTYLSDQRLRKKFGRRLQKGDKLSFGFDVDFAVESYLAHQAKKFNQRFDANTYLYITRALDYYDFAQEEHSYIEAFQKTQASFLFMAFSSDWLYPPEQNRELFEAALAAGRSATYVEVASTAGHDSFLVETEQASQTVAQFLAKITNAL